MTEATMNRLDEIEGRAKAVADEPRCTDCGREVILHDMLCGDCGVDAICRDAGDDVPMRERHVSARYVDDVAWLVAQVRECDAEIARLRAALADLLPHAYTVASDPARRRAAELLEKESPHA